MATLFIDDIAIFNDSVVCVLIMSKNPYDFIDSTVHNGTHLSINTYLKRMSLPHYGEALEVRLIGTLKNKFIKSAGFQLVCNRTCYDCNKKEQNVLHFYTKIERYTTQFCKECIYKRADIAFNYLDTPKIKK